MLELSISHNYFLKENSGYMPLTEYLQLISTHSSFTGAKCILSHITGPVVMYTVVPGFRSAHVHCTFSAILNTFSALSLHPIYKALLQYLFSNFDGASNDCD